LNGGEVKKERSKAGRSVSVNTLERIFPREKEALREKAAVIESGERGGRWETPAVNMTENTSYD